MALHFTLGMEQKLKRNYYKKSEPAGLKVIEPKTSGLFFILNKIWQKSLGIFDRIKIIQNKKLK